MVKFIKKYHLPILSGLLAALSFPLANLGFLIWFAFIPLLIFVINYGEEKSRKEIFWGGLIAGFIYSLIFYRWFWSVYPLDSLGVHNNLIAFILVSTTWIATSFGYSLIWGAFAVAIKVISPTKKWLSILVIPSLWVVLEYIQSYGAGIYMAGKGASFGPHWGMSNIAYVLHNNSLALKLASIGGIYLVAFIILLVNVLLFRFITKKDYKKLGVLSILLLLISFSVLWVPEKEEIADIPVAVAQTKIPTKVGRSFDEEIETVNERVALLNQASALDPQPEIVILPEGANLSTSLNILFSPQYVQSYFKNLFVKPTLVIDSASIANEEGKKSKTIFLDSKIGLLETYDKRFLTPYGEYLPYYVDVMFSFFAVSKEKIQEDLLFDPGDKESPVRGVVNGPKVNVFVCAEVFSPKYVSEASHDIANAIIIQSSTGRFKGSQIVLREMEAAAQFRAAENNRYLIFATNYGISSVIDNHGRITKKAENNEARLFTGFIRTIEGKSWYNKTKDLILFLAVIIIFFAAISIWVQNKKSIRSS